MPAIVETSAALDALLRRHDYDRFLLTLFMPAIRRDAVRALYAFNYEIARIREAVTDPLLGQIRLQWWREGIDAVFAGQPVRRHEVLSPLAAAIAAGGLSREHFDRLIEARERDLAPEPPATVAALEAHAEETAAPLQLLVLQALGEDGAVTNQAARAAAIAYALAGLLRATPFLVGTRRFILPRALIDETGLDLELLFAGKASPPLAVIVHRIADRAAHHLAVARGLRGEVPRAALPALLPAVLAAADLQRLRRAGFNVFAAGVTRRDPWRSWRLTLASLRGRY